MPGIQWGLVTIVGVIVLFFVYIFVIRKNKSADEEADLEHTERATHELYEEEHAAAERREERHGKED